MPCVGRKYRKQGLFYGFNVGFINISIDRTKDSFFFLIFQALQFCYYMLLHESIFIITYLLVSKLQNSFTSLSIICVFLVYNFRIQSFNFGGNFDRSIPYFISCN